MASDDEPDNPESDHDDPKSSAVATPEPVETQPAQPAPEAAPGVPDQAKAAISKSFAAQGFGAPSADYKGPGLPAPGPAEEPQAPQSQEDRYAAARQKVDQDFASDFLAKNPFKTSRDVPPTPTDLYTVAQRRSDFEAASQERQQAYDQRQAQENARKQANSDQENAFRANGQQYFKDELGNIRPVTEPDTGRALFHKTGWTAGQNPQGEPSWVMRDQYGQRQFRAPPLVANPDLSNDNAFYRMPDGTTVDSGRRLEDFAQSKDFNVQRVALRQITERNSARRRQALDAQEALTAQATIPFTQAMEQKEGLQAQIGQLKAQSDAEQDPFRKDALAVHQQHLAAHYEALDALTKPGGALYHQNYAAQKEMALARANHALATYQDQQNEIEARVRAQGGDPHKDPTWISNTQAMQQIQPVIDHHTQDLQQARQLQANKPVPLTPAPATPSPTGPATAPPAGLHPDLKQSWASAGPIDRLKMIFGSKGYGTTPVEGGTPMIGSEAAGTKGGLFTIPKAQGTGAFPGVVDAANEFTSSLTSPENAALLVGTEGAGVVADIIKGTKLATAARGAQIAALAGFTVQGGKSTIDAANEAKRLLKDPKATSADRARAVATAILSAAMTAGAAGGTVHLGRGMVEGGRGGPGEPPPEPNSKAAPKGPTPPAPAGESALPATLTEKERAAAGATPGTPEEQAAAARELETRTTKNETEVAKTETKEPISESNPPKSESKGAKTEFPAGTKIEYLGKRNQVMEGVGDKVDHWQVKMPGEDRGRTLTRDQLEKDGFDTTKLPTDTPAQPQETTQHGPRTEATRPIREEVGNQRPVEPTEGRNAPSGDGAPQQNGSPSPGTSGSPPPHEAAPQGAPRQAEPAAAPEGGANAGRGTERDGGRPGVEPGSSAAVQSPERPPQEQALGGAAPAESGGQGPRAGKEPRLIRKGKRFSVGSPPGELGYDILNAIEESGGIKPKSAAKERGGQKGGEYDDIAGTFTGRARLLLNKTGRDPDQLAAELHADGHLPNGDVSTMMDAVTRALRQRQMEAVRFKKQEYETKFDNAFMGDEKGRKYLKAGKSTSVDQLAVGDEFHVNGEHFQVTDIDEHGNVHVKDGVKRTLPSGTDVFPDRGKVLRDGEDIKEPLREPVETKHGPVEGEHINAEWRQFDPESKSLGVPRAEMPQVKSSDRGALIDYLKGKSIGSKDRLVKPTDLKPTQAEYSPAKVETALQHEGGDRNLLVSSDNYIVDGHHQWMADLEGNPDRPIKVTQLDKPINEVLPAVKEFPAAKTGEGAGNVPADGAPPKTRSDRMIEALQAAKINKPGMVHDAVHAVYASAHDAALDLAILAIKAGRTVADAVKIAVARFKALHPEATDEQVNRLESVIRLSDSDAAEVKAAQAPGSDQRVTSIKNAVVDEERAARGLPPAMQAARRSFGAAWDEAMRRIETDPNASTKLVEDLNRKPRALTDTEDAMLLHRQVDLQNQFDKTAADLLKGQGDQTELRTKAAALSDQLLDVYNAGKAAGTETGRGLNARKMLAKEDYSLAKMQTRLRAAKGGEGLTDRETAMINTLHDKIIETQKAFDEYKAATEDRKASAEADRVIKKIVSDVQGKAKGQAQGSLNKFISDQAAAARARLRERVLGGRVNDVTSLAADLADRAIIGAEYIAKGVTKFADFAKEWVKEFGQTTMQDIAKIYKKAQETHEAMTKSPEVEQRDIPAERASTVAGMKKAIEGGKKPGDLTNYVQTLARQFVEEGVTDREKLIDAVHEEIKKVAPQMTRREAMDAISGYGKYRPLSSDEVSTQLRDLKGQMQQVGKLEDMQAGQAPAKTGVQRRVPSDEERRLLQQVNEAKRRGGFTVTDPAAQLKSALEGVKTRLRNGISDLQFQIDTGKKTVKTKTEVPLDAEAKALQAQRDALQEQFDAIFKKPDLTDAQRLKIAEKSTDSQIAEIERQLKSGEIFDKEKRQPVTSPELEAKRARLDALKQEREYARQLLQPGPDPKSKADVALAAYKTRTLRRIADLQDRVARGDVTKAPKRVLEKDPEAEKLAGQVDAQKLAFDRMVRAHELNQRGWWQKAMEQVSGAARASALSGYHTLAKLASFTGLRLAEVPSTEAASKVWSQIPGFKEISKKATFEGGPSSRSMATFFTKFATEGMEKAAQQLKSGTTDTKAQFGKKEVDPPHWYDFFGNLHAAEKTPLLTGAHEMYIQKAYEHAIANGVDVSDPMVQGAIRKDAFDYANRQILQENNQFAQWINDGLRRAQKADPDIGRVSAVKNTLAEAFRTIITKGIVRTPANYVMQTLERTPLGLAEGLRQAGAARWRGVESLSPKEADGIMRLLAAGAVGSGMFAWGMIDATKDPKDRTFGGYYSSGDKRDGADVGFGAIRLDGHQIPHLLTHSPMTESAQMGSTFMRVMLSKLHKKDRENQGALSGAIASLAGLAESAPIANEVGRLGKIGTPTEQTSVVGEAIRGLIPQLVQNVAEDTDKGGVARAPKTVGEHVEMGIPGLREQVGPKAKKHPTALDNLLIAR